MFRLAAMAFALACALQAQSWQDRWPRLPDSDPTKETTVRLPGGKKQSEEILKAEHEKSLAEVKKLRQLAEDLEDELVKNDRHVLSLSALKKTEEIEKLAKRIRNRIRK